MSLAVQVFIFAVGVGLVTKGADWFVDSAVWLARVARIPRVLVGATIVSLATTLPETAVSLYASYSGRPDTAVGNAVGSVIFNTCVVLSTALLIRPVRIERRSLLPKAGFMVLAGAVAYLMMKGGSIGPASGVGLLGLLVLYIIYSIWSGRAEAEAAATTAVAVTEGTWRQLAGFAGGAAMVFVGGRALVTSGVAIARAVGVPEVAIALTLIAVGTSLPELATSVAALLKGFQDLSVGNVMGANFLNMTLVLGGAAVINPLPAARQILVVSLPVMLIVMSLTVVFGLTRPSFERGHGLLLVAVYVVYLALTFSGG
ncbi:MAG: calcium/sodium antiporter [bacterium]|nr:calcium/sodium antiporter [bacterium]